MSDMRSNRQSAEVLVGDCRQVLSTLPDESVHCVVTSPPYLGLRDYGTAEWVGGVETCAHVRPFVPRSERTAGSSGISKGGAYNDAQDMGRSAYRETCADCGATRSDRQIGLEATPEEYVRQLVAVFREVRRVLHPSGLMFLNLGDSYAGSWGAQSRRDVPASISRNSVSNHPKRASHTGTIRQVGLKPKDLMMIPARVALALQADGWWLRQDIIWAKKAPMPESVTDRFTSSHEHVFMLSKSERYFYDQDAIREPHKREWWDETVGPGYMTAEQGRNDGGKRQGSGTPSGANKRDVWFLGPEPTPFAHFATMPQALVEPCILAGTSAKGCCPECLAPWQRVVERTGHVNRREPAHVPGNTPTKVDSTGWAPVSFATNTWGPTCTHDAEPIPCTVLDPFAGSGTVLRVAVRHGRRALGIELNPEYAEIIQRRLHTDVRLPLDFSEEAVS